MEDIKEALYQQTRLTILLTAKDGHDKSPFSPAYLYAWSEEIYPVFSDSADWHKPHKSMFWVKKDMVLELHKFLSKFSNKKSLAFYELEEQYQVYSEVFGLDNKIMLIQTCRYMFLAGLFDKNFWDTLVKNGNRPTEAVSITSEQEDEICFE